MILTCLTGTTKNMRMLQKTDTHILVVFGISCWLIVITDTDGIIRIISARKATPKEEEK